MKNKILDNYLLYDGKEKKLLMDLMYPLGISYREITSKDKVIAGSIISGGYKVIVINKNMFSTLEDKLFTISYLIADYIMNGMEEYKYAFSISNIDTDVYKLARKIYERRILYSNIDRKELKKVLK